MTEDSPAVAHHLSTWGIPHGWGWSCTCGVSTRGGYAPTQRAAYSYGERHVRNALSKTKETTR